MSVNFENVDLWNEATSANQLIEQGIELLRDSQKGSLPEKQQALFSVLSLGVEKYLKISLGLIALKGSGKWPTKKEFIAFGHGIVAMNKDLMTYIHSNVNIARYPKFINKSLDSIPDWQVMEQIITTLSRYADKGRFYSIDSLSGSPQKVKSPDELWIEVENRVTELNPSICSVEYRGGEAVSYENLLSEAIAQYFIAWQRLIAYSAVQGLFGDKGKLFGNYIEVADYLI